MSLPRLLVVTLLLSIAPPLGAAVVERDFQSVGDGLLTYDDEHQREWLDLTVTEGMTPGELQGQLSASGNLNGFSVATLEDLEGLAASAGVPWLGRLELPGEPGDSADALINLFGEQFPTVVIGYPIPDDAEGAIADDLDGDGPNAQFTPSAYDDDGLQAVQIVFGTGGTNTQTIRTTSGLIASPTSGSYQQVVALSVEASVPPLLKGLGLIDPFSGGISHVNLREDETAEGPFWLIRAVPEPSSALLLMLGTTLTCSRRDRR